MSAAATPQPQSTVTAASAAAPLPLGSVLGGRYRLDALLGMGGMGVVYRAHDLSLDIDVALKLLRPELSAKPEAFQRFRQELLLARQVSSPNVLRIHDLASDGPHWFISMDYVDGESLDRLLEREIRLTPERALAIAGQVAAGLAAAHAQQVVHRDLKPANVLIGRDGMARISDFGVARSLASTGLTHTGAIVGTPDYLSPEQAKGEAVDARSDLYALGLLLYEMLSGQLPFASATPAEALAQRIAGRITPLRRLRPELPVWIERLVARLLSSQPRHRWASAAAVLHALQAQKVARDWRPWLRPALLTSLLLATLLLLSRLPQYEAQPVAQAPPERLVVWVEGDVEADLAAALGETLRQALANQGETAVVDGLRTAHGLQRAGRDPRQRREQLPASRWLRLQLQPAAPNWIARARLSHAADSDGAVVAEAQAADAAAALQALQPGLMQALGLASDAPLAVLLPQRPEHLLALGAALRQLEAGKLEAAMAALEALLTAEPDYALGWLLLADASLLAGDRGRVRSAVSAGQRLGRTALAEAFALRGDLLEGDDGRAVERLRQRVAQLPGDFTARLRLAQLLGARGDYEAAEPLLVELLQRDPGEARAWFLRGKFAILRGPLQAAVDEYLVRAVLLAKRARDRFGEAEAVNALGIAYARLGQIDDAADQYRRALALRREIGDRRGSASSLRNLAQLAMVQGRSAEAGELLRQARELFDALADAEGLAAVDNELGLISEERGDYKAALAAYRSALRSREALGDRRAVAESLNNIGFAEFQLGDYDSAQVFWQQAESAFAALDDHNGRVRTAQNLGLLDFVRGRWDAAAQRLTQSLHEAEQQQLAEEQAVSRRNLAELALWRGQLGAAQQHLEAAKLGFAAREDRRGLIDLQLLQGNAWLGIGDQAALATLLDALAAGLDEASTEQRAQAALLRGEWLRLSGEDAGADAALNQAAKLADAAGVRALALQIVLARDGATPALGQALQALGHRPLWLQWAERALRERRLPAAAAAGLYREAAAALPTDDGYLAAWRLHRHGARVLRAAADGNAAAQAEARAERSLEALLAAAPPAWQAALRAHAARESPP